MNYLTSVRFGRDTTVENFVTDLPDLREEDRCVVRTDRGLELGEVVSAPDPLPACLSPESFPRILRRAAFDDLIRAEEIDARRREATVFAREEAQRLHLPIEVRGVEITLGGELMAVSFVPRGLVHLVPLIHRLSERYGARILFLPAPPEDAGGCRAGG